MDYSPDDWVILKVSLATRDCVFQMIVGTDSM